MKYFACILLAAVLLMSAAVYAQDATVAAPADAATAPATATADPNAAPTPVLMSDPTSAFEQSLLFTPAEIVALRRASEGSVVGTAVINANQQATVIPPRRLIALSGVYLRRPGDWIVWINGKKMTPKDLLPEVMDISVQRDRVHLKWFDIGLNNVISITLRPHQTYDIVTGVLLPG